MRKGTEIRRIGGSMSGQREGGRKKERKRQREIGRRERWEIEVWRRQRDTVRDRGREREIMGCHTLDNSRITVPPSLYYPL